MTKKIISVENIAFEGGGVLGFAYAGVITALEEKNILHSIKRVAGTSVGAIVSLFLSLRYNAVEIQDILYKTDFKKFTDSFNPLQLFTKYGVYRGQLIFEWIQSIITQRGFSANASFSDFKENNCRELRVFATDLNLKSTQEFSYRSTPNVIVAEAIRASVSLPLLFEAWQFSNKTPNNHLFVDGGLLYEFPINTFRDVNSKTLKKTLGVHFLPTRKNEELQFHQITNYIQSLMSLVMGFSYKNAEVSTDAEIRKSSIGIPQLDISSQNFKISDEDKKKLFNEGYVRTLEFLQTNNNPSFLERLF